MPSPDPATVKPERARQAEPAENNPGTTIADSGQIPERQALVDDLLDAHEAIATNVLDRVTRELLEIPLTIQQLKVLGIVGVEAHGSTVQDIARALHVSLATVSGIVDRLTNQAMVARIEDPSDARVRRVVMTPDGRAMMRRLLLAQPQFERPILDALALEDLRALAQGVRALVGTIAAQEAVADDDA